MYMDNPASRLYQALNHLADAGINESTTLGQRIQSLPPGEPLVTRIEFLDCFAAVLTLPLQVYAAVRPFDGDYLISHFQEVEKALMHANLQMPAAKLAQLLPEKSMSQLETAGEFLHRNHPEPSVDEQFLADLAGELQRLLQEVREAEGIHDSIRSRLVVRLERLLAAIRLVHITGLGVVVDQANAAIGEGLAEGDKVDHPLKRRFYRTLAYIGALPVILTPQLVMIQQGAEMVTSITEAVAAVRELSGPKALPAGTPGSSDSSSGADGGS